MVDTLIGKKPHFIQSFGYKLFFAPVDIPIISISLFPTPPLKGTLNTVIKECFKLDFRTEIKARVTGGGENDPFLCISESTTT